MSHLSDVIWWQVFPLGACGAPIRERTPTDGGHRLRALEPWLDYLIGIGCNGLLLGPIFESVSHGYDTVDHYRIDRRLGDDADFDRLIRACQERGIRVMLDGVFNHVAASHPEVSRLALRSPDGKPQAWEGHDELIVIDHSRPEVQDFVVDIMCHWLRRGIAGWRLDVAYAVPPEFWKAVIARVREEFPEAFFLGEVIHGDYPAFVAESTLDTVTQYELWKGIWSSLKEANCWELAWAFARHNEFMDTFTPQTFIGNHDVERIASQVGENKAILAAAILLTTPGSPSIYYGDEQGFRGRKLEGFHADDELRPPLPATPADLLPAGEHIANIYKGLISIRRNHPWITRGTIAVVDKQNEWIEYTVTERDATHPEHRLGVRIDVAPRAHVTITGSEGTLFAWGADRDEPATSRPTQSGEADMHRPTQAV